MAREKISAASTVGGDSVGINLSVVVLTALRAEGDENGGGWRLLVLGVVRELRASGNRPLGPGHNCPRRCRPSRVREGSNRRRRREGWVRITVWKGGGG